MQRVSTAGDMIARTKSGSQNYVRQVSDKPLLIEINVDIRRDNFVFCIQHYLVTDTMTSICNCRQNERFEFWAD